MNSLLAARVLVYYVKFFTLLPKVLSRRLPFPPPSPFSQRSMKKGNYISVLYSNFQKVFVERERREKNIFSGKYYTQQYYRNTFPLVIYFSDLHTGSTINYSTHLFFSSQLDILSIYISKRDVALFLIL